MASLAQAPLTFANGDATTLVAASETHISVGSSVGLPTGTILHVGARARNSLGLFGEWLWSAPTVINPDVKASIDVAIDWDGEPLVPVKLELDRFDDMVASEATGIQFGSKLSVLKLANSVRSFEYGEITPGSRRLGTGNGLP